MTPIEVLKMLKSKIDAAGLNKCNYVIETSDIEAINQALRIHDVVGRSELYFAFMEEYNALMGEGEHQILKEEVVVLLAKY